MLYFTILKLDCSIPLHREEIALIVVCMSRRKKKQCSRGPDCPYRDEHQHQMEYSHHSNAAKSSKGKRKRSSVASRRRSEDVSASVSSGRRLGGGSSKSRPSKSWDCARCTLVNTGDSTTCQACEWRKTSRKDVGAGVKVCDLTHTEEGYRSSNSSREDVVDLMSPVAKKSSRSIRQEQDDAYALALAKDMSKIEHREKQESKKKCEIVDLIDDDDEDEVVVKKAKPMSEPDDGPGVCCVLFKLPDGKKIRRRFQESDTVKFLFAFLDVELREKNSQIERYSLKWIAHPTISRESQDAAKSLRDCGLFGRVAIYLCDLDK